MTLTSRLCGFMETRTRWLSSVKMQGRRGLIQGICTKIVTTKASQTYEQLCQLPGTQHHSFAAGRSHELGTVYFKSSSLDSFN